MEHHNGADTSYALEFTYSGARSQARIFISQDQLNVVGVSTNTFDLSSASYDTIGELAAGIDALDYFACNLDNCDLGYDYDSGFCYNVSSGNIGTDDAYSVLIDTNGYSATDAFIIAYRIPANSYQQVLLQKIASIPKTAGDDIEIRKENNDTNASTKVWDSNLASNSAEKEYDFTSSGANDGWLFDPGEDVVIYVNGTVAQADGDYLTVQAVLLEVTDSFIIRR